MEDYNTIRPHEALQWLIAPLACPATSLSLSTSPWYTKWEVDNIIFSSAELPVGSEKIFIIASYDNKSDCFRIEARDSRLEEESEIQVPKNSGHVLGIQYRANGLSIRTIRYSLDPDDERKISFFDKYAAKKQKF